MADQRDWARLVKTLPREFLEELFADVLEKDLLKKALHGLSNAVESKLREALTARAVEILQQEHIEEFEAYAKKMAADVANKIQHENEVIVQHASKFRAFQRGE